MPSARKKQGCGKQMPSASVRICYVFLTSKCREESDLGLCMTSVLAKWMWPLRSADFQRVLRPNTVFNQRRDSE